MPNSEQFVEYGKRQNLGEMVVHLQVFAWRLKPLLLHMAIACTYPPAKDQVEEYYLHM